MKKLACTALAAVMAFSLAACGSGSSGTGDSDAAVYRVLYGGEVETLNYLVSSSTDELKSAYNTQDCLVEYDSYGNVLPGLAESWERDGEVWTFHLRKGAKWVDYTGKEVAEVTANDFVSSAAYALDAANGSSTAYMMTNTLKNAEEYNLYTAYLVQSENGTKTTDAEGNPIEPVEEVSFEDVGVKALDDYTLHELRLLLSGTWSLPGGKGRAVRHRQPEPAVLRRLLHERIFAPAEPRLPEKRAVLG